MFKYLHTSCIIYISYYEGKSFHYFLNNLGFGSSQRCNKACRVERSSCFFSISSRLSVREGKQGEVVAVRLNIFPPSPHKTNSKHLISLLSLQNSDLFEMIERMQVRRLSGFWFSCACLSWLPMLHFTKQLTS